MSAGEAGSDALAAQPRAEKARQTSKPGAHQRGLLLIGLFKLTKSLFFFCVGIGAFHLLHKDLSDEALRLAHALRFEPEGRLTQLLMEKVTLIDSHRLREIGLATFAYSGVALVEGMGLMLEKVWAEFLTLSLTVMFLPWEVWEIVREATWLRFSLLLINLVVLLYLVWLLDRKRKATDRS